MPLSRDQLSVHSAGAVGKEKAPPADEGRASLQRNAPNAYVWGATRK
jgi:hypothetical protein